MRKVEASERKKNRNRPTHGGRDARRALSRHKAPIRGFPGPVLLPKRAFGRAAKFQSASSAWGPECWLMREWRHGKDPHFLVPEAPGSCVEQPARRVAENFGKNLFTEALLRLGHVAPLAHHHDLSRTAFRRNFAAVFPPKKAVQMPEIHIIILPPNRMFLKLTAKCIAASCPVWRTACPLAK